MAISLTPRQQDALRFIQGHIIATGFAPSFAQILCALDLRSNSSAYRLIEGLADRGAIRRLPGRARAMEVLQPIAIPRAPDGAPLHFVTIEGLA